MTVQLSAISKDYLHPNGKLHHVVRDIDFTIEENNFIVLLGESGCGKSTLLKMIAGLVKPSHGRIEINGQVVDGPSPERMLLFQQPSLLPWLTVRDNIAFGCRLRGETSQLREKVADLIDMIGLNGFEMHHPAELSIGMAQRVALARAIIAKPKLLLLDEPFSSLDSFHKSRMQRGLINIWQKERFTAVFVTHDIDEAMMLGQKIHFLGGKPSRIEQSYAIDLPYPRQINDSDYLQLRTRIAGELEKHIHYQQIHAGGH